MIEVSNAARIVFPDAGTTKGEVVHYYERVAHKMLPHLAGRPLTLERFPKGLAGGGFMQKNTPKHYPASIERFSVDKREGETTTYPVVHVAEDLPYLANQGTITFHVWPSRLPEPWTPDRIVFDLDPPEGSLARVREAATVVREFLSVLGLDAVPVATGSKGFHVVAPILPTVPPDRLSNALFRAAHLLAGCHEDLLTVEFRKENRGGRVFLDWMRNHPGATSVCPWSLRPRPNASVATPLSWDEVDSTAPDGWTLQNIDDRLAAPDPLLRLVDRAQDPAMALEALEAKLDAAGVHPEPFDRFRS
jgi:bifunctional non-homologous end joining protein LigD